MCVSQFLSTPVSCYQEAVANMMRQNCCKFYPLNNKKYRGWIWQLTGDIQPRSFILCSRNWCWTHVSRTYEWTLIAEDLFTFSHGPCTWSGSFFRPRSRRLGSSSWVDFSMGSQVAHPLLYLVALSEISLIPTKSRCPYWCSRSYPLSVLRLGCRWEASSSTMLARVEHIGNC